jgi:hypothetical protein
VVGKEARRRRTLPVRQDDGKGAPATWTCIRSPKKEVSACALLSFEPAGWRATAQPNPVFNPTCRITC